VSSFDHDVTQWMAVENVSDGRDCRSGQLSLRGTAISPHAQGGLLRKLLRRPARASKAEQRAAAVGVAPLTAPNLDLLALLLRRGGALLVKARVALLALDALLELLGLARVVGGGLAV
jgi:hypothetical protein